MNFEENGKVYQFSGTVRNNLQNFPTTMYQQQSNSLTSNWTYEPNTSANIMQSSVIGIDNTKPIPSCSWSTNVTSFSNLENPASAFSAVSKPIRIEPILNGPHSAHYNAQWDPPWQPNQSMNTGDGTDISNHGTPNYITNRIRNVSNHSSHLALKRKLRDSCGPRNKKRLTDEKMAARMGGLCISGSRDTKCSYPPSSDGDDEDEEDEELRDIASHSPQHDLRVELSDVLRNGLDSTADNILPYDVAEKIYNPCTDIVLWQPRNVTTLEELVHQCRQRPSTPSPSATHRIHNVEDESSSIGVGIDTMPTEVEMEDNNNSLSQRRLFDTIDDDHMDL